MECEKKEYQLQALCFAAGAAVFMAFLERTVGLSFLEQWRVSMFLALNLLLLAILFTSTSPVLSKVSVPVCVVNEEKLTVESAEQKREQQCQPEMACLPKIGNKKCSKHESDEDRVIVAKTDLKDQGNAEANVKEQANQLSTEELNERVEAFIAMFKQHLRSDAMGGSCSQLNSYLSMNGRTAFSSK